MRSSFAETENRELRWLLKCSSTDSICFDERSKRTLYLKLVNKMQLEYKKYLIDPAIIYHRRTAAVVLVN